MDFKGLIDTAKNTLQNNPGLVDKGGDALDQVTGGKYAGQVDKAQEAIKKAVGAEQQKADEPKADEAKAEQPKADEENK